MKKIMLLMLIASCQTMLLARESSSQDNAAQTFDNAVYGMSRTMGNVLSLVKDKHYNVTDPAEAFRKALQSLMKSLDSHSDFMDSSAFTSIMETTAGSFFGIGVIIDNLKDPELEYLKVIDVQPGGPADKAGIRANDKIVEVDGNTLRGLTVEECRDLIKGKRHTVVALKVLREGNSEVMTFKIARDTVNEQNACCYYFKDPEIYYLSLNVFTENSIKQVGDSLSHCKEKSCKGLIIDLRNNTGGLLNAAIDIAGLFLDKGSLVVTTRNRDNKILDSFSTTRDPLKLPEMPIFILVNNFTASAAEILAGCLKAYSQSGKQKTNKLHVFIVGTTTFGKGSVQEVIPVGEECAIRITTSLYYLPDDYCVQQTGITPDFIVPNRILPPNDVNWFTEQFGKEKSLKNSIARNGQADPQKKQPPVEKSWQERREEAIGSDHQILSTVRLTNFYNVLTRTNPTQSRTAMIETLQKQYVASDKLAMVEVKI